MKTITLHFDGATEPRNPGGWMIWAWTLDLDGHALGQGAEARPPRRDNTNNVAEWFALGAGLKALVQYRNQSPSLQGAELSICGDSQLVIRQLRHEWKCNLPRLQECRRRCLDYLKEIRWRANWIAREQNQAADSLTQSKYLEVAGRAMPDRNKSPRRCAGGTGSGAVTDARTEQKGSVRAEDLS